MSKILCEIQPYHVGQEFHQLPCFSNLMGHGFRAIQVGDVGCRVIESDGTIHVEAREWRDARLAKLSGPKTFGYEPVNLGGLDEDELATLHLVYADLAAYCTLKRAAMARRLRGDIQDAIAAEAEAQAKHDNLPKWARW